MLKGWKNLSLVVRRTGAGEEEGIGNERKEDKRKSGEALSGYSFFSSVFSSFPFHFFQRAREVG